MTIINTVLVEIKIDVKNCPGFPNDVVDTEILELYTKPAKWFDMAIYYTQLYWLIFIE